MAQLLHHSDARDSNSNNMMPTTKRVKEGFFSVQGLTAGDFPLPSSSSSEIYEILASATVNEAFQDLAKRNILSAPVWDAAQGKYLGFLDVGDLLALSYGIDQLLMSLPPLAVQEASKNTDGGKITIGELYTDDKESECTKWCPVSPDTPFVKVLELLATETRRVPVIEPSTGRVRQIISQSAVVNVLYHNILEAGPSAPKSLNLTPRQTGIGIREVITVGEEEPARNAFQKLVTNKISAVGVVDSEGRIYTCVSTKDVRLLPKVELALSQKNHNILSVPVRNYVAAVRRVAEKDGRARPSLVSCTLDTPMRTILGKLAEARLHRIFVVGEGDKPVGVISVSDIMTSLLEEQ